MKSPKKLGVFLGVFLRFGGFFGGFSGGFLGVYLGVFLKVIGGFFGVFLKVIRKTGQNCGFSEIPLPTLYFCFVSLFFYAKKTNRLFNNKIKQGGTSTHPLDWVIELRTMDSETVLYCATRKVAE